MPPHHSLGSTTTPRPITWTPIRIVSFQLNCLINIDFRANERKPAVVYATQLKLLRNDDKMSWGAKLWRFDYQQQKWSLTSGGFGDFHASPLSNRYIHCKFPQSKVTIVSDGNWFQLESFEDKSFAPAPHIHHPQKTINKTKLFQFLLSFIEFSHWLPIINIKTTNHEKKKKKHCKFHVKLTSSKFAKRKSIFNQSPRDSERKSLKPDFQQKIPKPKNENEKKGGGREKN